MKKIVFIAFLFTSLYSFSQVGVGTNSPSATSALDVTSTTKGLLLPRLTHVQKMAISNPATGLWVWCTDCGVNGEMQVYNGTAWTNMVGGPAILPYSPYLLDNFGIIPEMAYSLRLLRSSYTGPAIRVVRSTDEAEMDIGFDSNGNLNVTDLLAFIGSASAFVDIWYDQSGNNNHMTGGGGPDFYPQIVSAGIVTTMSGKPTLKTTSGNSQILYTVPINPITINHINVVGQSDGITSPGSEPIFFRQFGPTCHFGLNTNENFNAYASNTASIISNSTQISTVTKIYSAIFPSGKLYANGNEIGSGIQSTATPSPEACYLFNVTGLQNSLNGSMSELIVFPMAVNRSVLEQNQGNYYGITIN